MTERVRLYTDEHVPTAVVRGLRQRGVDVLTVKEAGRLSASDREHLTFALEENRVIFTQDDDFLRLHAAGEEHAGIVYARQQTRVGDVIHGLILVHEVLKPEEMKGHVEYLQKRGFFGGFDLSGTDSKAGGPDYPPPHILAKTVVERL